MLKQFEVPPEFMIRMQMARHNAKLRNENPGNPNDFMKVELFKHWPQIMDLMGWPVLVKPTQNHTTAKPAPQPPPQPQIRLQKQNFHEDCFYEVVEEEHRNGIDHKDVGSGAYEAQFPSRCYNPRCPSKRIEPGDSIIFRTIEK